MQARIDHLKKIWKNIDGTSTHIFRKRFTYASTCANEAVHTYYASANAAEGWREYHTYLGM